MPSLSEKTFASYFKNLLTTDQPGNTGIDDVLARIQDGDGNDSAILLSDDAVSIKPVDNDGAGVFQILSTASASALRVDTSSPMKVVVGESQVHATTLFKEMGLYDFGPASAGYHYPLIANTMFPASGADNFASDADWNNGDDPASTLDVSGLSEPENAIAIYWYIEDNITLDSVRFMAYTEGGSVVLNFHLEAYTISSIGDLSGGLTHASASVTMATAAVKNNTFSLDEADIDAGKVVIGFVENVTDTSSISVSFNIKYHIR